MMYLGRDFFNFTLFGDCSTSKICKYLSFSKHAKFSTIISSNVFPAPHSFFSPSGSIRKQTLGLQLSQWTFEFYSLIFLFLLIIFYLLCYYSCPDLSPFAPLHAAPTTLSGNPPPLFMQMGHVSKFFGFSIPYTALYIPVAIL